MQREISPQEHLYIKKVFPFGHFKVIPISLCYLIDTLTNNYSMVSSSVINYVYKFQEVSKESPSHKKESQIIIYSFQEKTC